MSDSFAADWLALRAPADERSRAWALLELLAPRLAALSAGRALRITDLGAGAGNNLAALAPRLAARGLARQEWRLVDSDAALLAEAAARPPLDGIGVASVTGDLGGDLAALAGPAPDLITASALVDLAGAAWIERLAALAFARRAALLVVLSYDGRQAWSPPHEADEAVTAAFDADQRRDKGLGPALGPEGHACLAERLRDAGFAVAEATSDWVLEAPRDAALIAALAAGTAEAATPALGPRAADWGAARAEAKGVLVGHRDLAAWLPDPD